MEISCPLFTPPNAHDNQSWARLKPVARNSFWITHLGRSPKQVGVELQPEMEPRPSETGSVHSKAPRDHCAKCLSLFRGL